MCKQAMIQVTSVEYCKANINFIGTPIAIAVNVRMLLVIWCVKHTQGEQ